MLDSKFFKKFNDKRLEIYPRHKADLTKNGWPTFCGLSYWLGSFTNDWDLVNCEKCLKFKN